MSQVDRFFEEELREIGLESREATHKAARELAADITRQIKQKFANPSLAFQRGVKVHEFKSGSYVRLSTILSAHAEEKEIMGNPNLWILLPEGQRRGFKRLSPGYWNVLQARYGQNLAIVPVNDGHVVLYRSRSGVVPIYKIQSTVNSKPKIDFYSKAEEIANKYRT